MTGKWRPSLWLVVGGALAGTLGLSFAGLVVLRYLGPEVGFRNAAMIIAVVIAALTAGLGWLLLRLILRPVDALAGYAGMVRAGRADATPPGRFGTRELGAMGGAVVDMAQALRAREATVRSFTDHVTHELKTPVSALQAAAELLEDDTTLSEESRALVGQVGTAAQVLDRQLAALRDVARARLTQRGGAARLDDLAVDLRAAHPDLDLGIDGGARALPMDAQALRAVLDQMLGNAAQAGATRVDLHLRDTPQGLLLRCADNGPGISPGNRARVFDPFFTTRRGRGGSGMGLTIAQALAESAGAQLMLEKDGGGDHGAVFTLRFPAA